MPDFLIKKSTTFTHIFLKNSINEKAMKYPIELNIYHFLKLVF